MKDRDGRVEIASSDDCKLCMYVNWHADQVFRPGRNS
jgi:hypothetical protein